MDTARIATLLHPFVEDSRDLPRSLLDNISTYIDLLVRWNQRINLTAIRDPEHIVTRHIGESLFAAHHLFPLSTCVGTPDGLRGEGHAGSEVRTPREEESEEMALQDGSLREERSRSAFQDRSGLGKGGRAALQGRVSGRETMRALAPVPQAKITLADIGSGAGFPGVPIKLWAPHVHVTLIESHHKKATFLRELARVLTLTDIDIQDSRAESLPKASFDVVTLRAVERFETILPIAAGLVVPGGRLALLIGVSQVGHATRSLEGFAIRSDVETPESESRRLVIASKSS